MHHICKILLRRISSMFNNFNKEGIKRLFVFWVDLIDSYKKIEKKEQLKKYIIDLIENRNIHIYYIENILHIEDEEHLDDYSLQYIVENKIADYLEFKLHLALYIVYNAKAIKYDIDTILEYFNECSDILDEYVFQKNIKRAVTFQEQMECAQSNVIRQLFAQYIFIIKVNNFKSMNELKSIERKVFKILDLE